jgi:uncharacterized protein YbaP (TraB family)
MPTRRTRHVAFAAFAIAVTVWTAATAQTPAPSGKSFLWKVQSSSGVLYLAGSVHALNQKAYPLSPAFQRAFDASSTLVEEIDLAQADPLAMAMPALAKGMNQDGRTFDQIVSRDTARLVADRIKDVPMMAGMIQSMEPWMVNLLLSAVQLQQAGLDPQLGLDKHFYDKAKANGKTVIGLETAESQLDRLDRLPLSVQEQMLRSTLDDWDKGNSALETLVAVWKRGDAAALEKLLLADFTDYPAVYTSLIVERNRNWLPQLETCLGRPSPCFVVVGAAHIVGPDGLLAMLQRKGYRIEQQ